MPVRTRLLPVALGLLLAACASTLAPPDRALPPTDAPLPRKPRKRSPSLANEILEMTFGYQLWQVLDTPRLVRKIAGHPYEALNVDNFDGVPNTTWFTNRVGAVHLPPAAVERGPGHIGPPDPTGPWQVVALKTAGVTPGLTIVDPRGHRYIIKFDPPGYAELGSGTECVASRLLWAAGYNVPENHVTFVDLASLTIAPGAEVSVASDDGRAPLARRPMVAADLQEVFARVAPEGGAVRALASLYLPGVPIGPFPYTGVRRDDANDLYAHEHRRELRGLYIVASWINHADWKEENTLDMYDPRRGVVTHYLIDFGAAMGSNSTGPSNPRRGQANSFDLKDALTRLATLGLYVHDYERAPRTVAHPSVGHLDNDLFEPHRWKPMYPCPAFENLTARDAFWGVRIVTSFTDAQIEAAVAAGRYSSATAADLMVRFLVERRDRIGRYWFARLNSLDRFAVAGDTLVFTDLAETGPYTATPTTGYSYRVAGPGGKELARGLLGDGSLTLSPSWVNQPHLSVSLAPVRPGYRTGPVVVFLRRAHDSWQVVGLRRPG